MPAYPHIEAYYAELRELIAAGGSDSELNIRPAFQNCLAAYCRDHREHLVLVPELRASPTATPDGAVRDALRMTRGWWEAKDARDDLDAEIQRKFNRGYPRDNIVFEDSQTAVLFQNGGEAMRADMQRPGELHRLIRRFLDHELPQIEEFRRARQQFKADLPAVLKSLRETIEEAEAESPAYREAAAAFLDLCKRSIGPDVSDADVREMLLQHVLTKDIFLRVFGEEQFHRENNVAMQLDSLERTFFVGDVRRNAVERLRAYYGAIGRAADEIADYAEKQEFLKRLYEDFYQAYNPAAADRMGVVYTPNEIVDFIIRGADALSRKHFGRGLADDNVQILDPATGTGAFVTSLINFLPADRLERKYREEIHANELAILPYYIANLNIEYAYKERTGRYLEFPHLCFVDTLDNMDWQRKGATGEAVQRQAGFELASLSEENWLRVQEQNEKTISVIIGNPPYNANQRNENENNKNREYPEVDKRIKETYVAESSAQKTKQYDMYKRFIRWASDRLADDGIIAFITNRSYIDSRQDDGFRLIAPTEFNDIYLVDLGGDVRANGRVGNVFGIRTGVAIGFFVRRSKVGGRGRIRYHALPDEQSGADKLAMLKTLDVESIPFTEIVPDEKHNWLGQSNSRFAKLLPMANRETKLAKSASDRQALFGLYSMGIVTNRDDWAWDFNSDLLARKISTFATLYAKEMARFEREQPSESEMGGWVDRTIKWTSELEAHLRKGDAIEFDPLRVTNALFRPFVAKSAYYAPIITHRRYQMPQVFPHDGTKENLAICFCVNGNDFYALATDRVVDLHFTGDTQCLPLYRYTAEGERVGNITEWGLRAFREHYRDDSITAERIFAYAYAVLHDPVYLHDYKGDLLREFPRLPFYKDFEVWARMGQELLDLHLGFESAEPHPLGREETGAEPGKPRLKADKERGVIVLDDATRLTGVPPEAWDYKLGSRSALEWVLDQYKERKPRDPTIAAQFPPHRFAAYKERVIDLLARVCAVSVRTTGIVRSMAYWDDGVLVVWDDRDQDEWATLGLSHWGASPLQ